MPSLENLQSHTLKVLRNEVKKTNMKKWSKLKKGELITMMMMPEHRANFHHLSPHKVIVKPEPPKKKVIIRKPVEPKKKVIIRKPAESVAPKKKVIIRKEKVAPKKKVIIRSTKDVKLKTVTASDIAELGRSKVIKKKTIIKKVKPTMRRLVVMDEEDVPKKKVIIKKK